VLRSARTASIAAAALAFVALALTSPATPAAAEAGRILGPPPPPGSFGLVVWGGGPVAGIETDARAHGCEAVSAWANRPGGGLLGYIFGAPVFVNRAFTTRYGEALPPSTPLVLVCAPELRPAASALSPDEARMVELINADRARAGLAALRVDLPLSAVARAHSLDMGERSYFGHTDPDGASPFDRMDAAGIEYGAAAENLAWAGDVDMAHRLLMDSPGHRANILGAAFARIGIGVARHPEYGWLFTQAFAD
jgi:uncharacterized protein YkwD